MAPGGRVLVLGGYGFIGAEIVRALIRDGREVVGLGRDAALGRRILPLARWIGADMARLDTADKWAPHLREVEAIVNAAGALQDGPRDRLDAVHHRAIAACVEAATRAGVKRFVQISAVGAELSAATPFMSSKALGDAAVKMSSLDWIILRPGLVIGRGAYGGTALLRMLAGFPLMTPLVFGAAPVQTVSNDDVANAVLAALKGDVPGRRAFDLVEDDPHTLREIVRGLRRQLGFAPAKVEPDLPPALAPLVGRLADLAGLLGWRSPLRTTALKVMREGVAGDPAPWRAAGGRAPRSFGETLAGLSGTAQERVFARAQVALPLMIVTLGMFWLVSGIVGLVAIDRAAAHLSMLGEGASKALVAGASLLDIGVGASILWRPTARSACLASIIVAGVYLAAGSMTEPQLWLDPFGTLVKVFPAMALAAATALLLEDR